MSAPVALMAFSASRDGPGRAPAPATGAARPVRQPVRRTKMPSGRRITVDTRSGFVSIGDLFARVSPLQAKLLAILVKASPRHVSRDRAIELIFKGRRIGDRAEYFRRILHETRAVLNPLGATILYVPNPEGSDLPGHLSLLEGTVEPRRRP
jgi:hypothetical protein